MFNNEIVAAVTSHEAANAVLRLMKDVVGYKVFDLKNPEDYKHYEEHFE